MSTKYREINTPRLSLITWSLDLVDAFAALDRTGAEAALDIRFPEPFAPPPETDDILDFFRTAIEQDRSDGAFLPRMIVRTEDRMAVGSIGLTPPDDDGRSMYGYGIYPIFEGNGYASEAAVALVEFGLSLDAMRAVFATIAVGHLASEIVSSRAGLTLTDQQIEDDGMTLNVWERRRS